MSENEALITAVLIVGYSAICYMCGKGDLLNVISLALQDKARELEEKLKDNDGNP